MIGCVFWWEVYYTFLLPYNELPVGILLALLTVDECGIFVTCEVCVYQYLLKIHRDYLSQTLPGKVCIATVGGECSVSLREGCLNKSVAEELLFVRLNHRSNWSSSFCKESSAVSVTDLTVFW